MEEQLQIRVYGDSSQPTLIYLPGLHGDWTLIGSFRRALGNRVRFVEITYPRTLTWSLDDYAANVEAALAGIGITRGWLLGESFSSQVVWPMVARGKFQMDGVILAGGFVRHPIRAGVRFAEKIARGISLRLLVRIMFGYAKLARFRYRHSPETVANIQEFIDRRIELDRQAAVHRLRLIAQSDHCAVARAAKIPIFALAGVLDPIVPWIFIRPWLRKNCPALREYKIMWRADHNVLSTAADASAEQVVRWINSK
ncbi:MAG TPA: alpha/beta hydrolase [Verrucomicrobiae bacterium]|jgi:pimeloyl-ACP methyl ester carboxylesterase